MYLELGELSDGHVYRDGRVGNSLGEITVYAGFDWRVEGQKITLNSHGSSSVQRNDLVSCLRGAVIGFAGLSGGGTELEVHFSNGTRLVTRSEDALEPDWSVSFNAQKLGHLCIQQGLLAIDRRDS